MQISDLTSLLPDQHRKQISTTSTSTNTNVLTEALFGTNLVLLDAAIATLNSVFDLNNMTDYQVKLLCELTGAPYIVDLALMPSVIRGHCAVKASDGTAFSVLEAFKLLLDSEDSTTTAGEAKIMGFAYGLPTSDSGLTDDQIAALINIAMQKACPCGVKWIGFELLPIDAFILGSSLMEEDPDTGDKLTEFFEA